MYIGTPPGGGVGSKKRAGAPAALRHRMRAAAPTWVLLGAVALLSLLTWRQQARLQQAQAQIRLYEQQQPVDAGCACAGRAHGAASGGRGPAAAAGSGVAAAALAPPSPAAAAPKLRAFIGVFTGFTSPKQPKDSRQRNYEDRRRVLRQTWFPGTPEERARWMVVMGLGIRFVIGHSTDRAAEAAVAVEQQQHGDMMRLDLQEDYLQLANKTRAFFLAAAAAFPDADWYVKMDDDVYLVPSRLLQVMGQWDRMSVDYVGCMKHGVLWKQPGTRWYEPHHLLLGNTYPLHAYGSIYAVRGCVVQRVIVRGAGHLRLLANEDTSVGLWMLAHNVTHFEDMRLCSPRCTAAAVGILDNACAGLCSPLTDLLEVHDDPVCRQQTPDPLPFHHSHPEHLAFEQLWRA